MKKIEKLNRKYNIHGYYQSYSEPYKFVGETIWNLHRILKDLDPEFNGTQYDIDIMHTSVESTYAWPYALRLIASWIIIVLAAKDYLWGKDNTGKWKDLMVPLGRRMIDFDTYLKGIKTLGIPTNFTKHNMYDLGGAELESLTPTISKKTIQQKIRKDMDFMKKYSKNITIGMNL